MTKPTHAMIEKSAQSLFDAALVNVVCRAADQDGYDGGFLAYDGEDEAWGETRENARLALERKKPKIHHDND